MRIYTQAQDRWFLFFFKPKNFIDSFQPVGRSSASELGNVKNSQENIIGMDCNHVTWSNGQQSISANNVSSRFQSSLAQTEGREGKRRSQDRIRHKGPFFLSSFFYPAASCVFSSSFSSYSFLFKREDQHALISRLESARAADVIGNDEETRRAKRKKAIWRLLPSAQTFTFFVPPHLLTREEEKDTKIIKSLLFLFWSSFIFF